MEKKFTFVAFAGLVVVLAALAGPAQAAPIEGELGILDVSGINPATGAQWAAGDSYRFVFITSTNTGTIGSDGNAMTTIPEFNAHMQSLADASTLNIGAADGATWRVLGSTSDANARDHTSTNPNVEVGLPILLLDGATIVANNNADLWDGSIQNIIGIDELGNAKSHWPHTGTYWDGTTAAGKPNSFGALDDPVRIAQGNGSSTTDWIWRQWTGRPATEQLPMYAISDPLTVVPEPATISLLVLGGLAMLRRRRS